MASCCYSSVDEGFLWGNPLFIGESGDDLWARRMPSQRGRFSAVEV
jgi:hypothetical protein